MTRIFGGLAALIAAVARIWRLLRLPFVDWVLGDHRFILMVTGIAVA
jgi:hypothetical protein